MKLGWETVEVRFLRSQILDRCGAADAAEVCKEGQSLAELNGQFRLSALYCGAGQPTQGDQSGLAAPVRSPGGQSTGGAILTFKEQKILGLLAQNLSNKEIAIALDLSEQTVKWHLKNLFQKLDGANRKHTVARARMLGLIAA